MALCFNKKSTTSLLLLFLAASNLLAQKTITGTVIDERRKPFVTCQIKIKDTDSYTISDLDGSFSLDVPKIPLTLEFSFPGHETQNIQITGETPVNVIMQEENVTYDTIILPTNIHSIAMRTWVIRTRSYAYTQYRKSYHYALIDKAFGEFYGISRFNSGSLVSNSSKLRMRTVNSVLSPDFLIAINDLPIDNSISDEGSSGVNNSYRINDLIENDIDNYKVFRNGNNNFESSSPNGTVALDYTMYSSNYTIEFISRFSVQQVNKLPATQSIYAQGRPINGIETWRGPELGEVFSWGPRIGNLEYDGQNYDYDKNGMLVPLGTGNRTVAKAFDKENFFGLGTTFENILLFTKRMERQDIKLCYSNLQEKGVVTNTGLERNNLNIHYYNDDYFVKIKFNTLLSNLKGKRAFQGNNSSGVLYGLLLSPPTFDLGNGKTGKAAANDNASYQLSNGNQRSFSTMADNPYWSINKNNYQDETNRIISNLNLHIDYYDMEFHNTTGIDCFWDTRDVAISPNSAHYINGRLTNRNETYKSIKSNSYSRYERNNYDKDYRFQAKLGHFYKNIDRIIDRIDGFDTGNNVNAQIYETADHKYHIQTNKIYSNLMYGKVNYFFVNASGAYEWLNFNTKKAGGLASYSACGNIHFQKLLNIDDDIDYFGIRVTYSSRQKKDAVFVEPAFYNSLNFDIDDELFAFEKLQVSNFSEVGPETINSMEIGLSLYAMNGKFDLNANYFNNRTNNLILPTNISSSSCKLINGGKLHSSGYELQLFYRPFGWGHLRWEIIANFSKYTTIVEELLEGIDRVPIGGFSSVSTNLIEGEEYGVIWGSRYLRDSEGQKIIGGDGFPLVDPENGIIGNPNPNWTVNIDNKITRKSFTFKFLVNIKKGGQVWNGTKNVLDYYGMSKNTGDLRNTSNYVFDGVDLNGNENTMAVDFANPTNPVEENRWVRYGKHGVAEDAIQDASWIRLSELSIGYNFPDDFTKRLKIRHVGISFFAKNLLLFTNYSGIDPDTYLPGTTNGAGLDYFNLPNVRSYGVELKAQF